MTLPTNPALPIVAVDDEAAILLAIDTTLRMAGFDNVITCQKSRQVLEILGRQQASVVLLDLNLPHLDGEALLPQITAEFPNIPIIVVTGAIDVDTAVRCMKSGAFDYIVKPVEESRLVAAVHQALKFMELHRENKALRDHLSTDRLEHPEKFEAIITNSPAMLKLFRYLESIATTAQPVLIRGETGVGKELMARAIHGLSGRQGQFVAVNVAGVDDSVFSDTLFGHVKGAFTGADSRRRGLIERASGGTLFLDEIGDLSHGSQVKLLRLLQENEYMPVGHDMALQTDARIIASTHADLWTLQQENRFRKDLHYRLRTHRILVPPLRERKEDLALLADHFLAEAARNLDKPKPLLTPKVLELIQAYHFPGNVRELQAMIFDALAQHRSGDLPIAVIENHMARGRQAEGTVTRDPSAAAAAITFADPLPTIKEATRLLIETALMRTGNNQSRAAAMLGISQQALSKRLKIWSQRDA
jgi:DNA-binding NtrC family response regulator